ncbi:hypothetical protein BJF81_15745 [Ornithinimicrobium sp. CNJ-824]|uniref:CBS domain-containing protein n=1 Tax=Ornithinimicrobium sp. CNJ-824 TaxID=1904966 RepID=UPI000962DA7B|nr:CBS domain-containing protein [Ornithinimicrobium sp. CNJ-824]OLT21096.1 hypothetical protein BJF81_15745 [Ornithinimicrobium sp. CNJ-824]
MALIVQDMSTAIRARQVAMPLEEALAVEPDDDASQCAARLAEEQYDYAPVLTDGMPVGIFERAAAPGPGAAVGAVMRPLGAELLVSTEATLSDLMRRMTEQPFVFVLDGCGVTGFVTPTDLGTVPVRTYFYLRLAHLENTLSEHLRRRYPDQMEAVNLLGPARRASHEAIAADLRSKDKFIDELSCLSLDDLVTVAGKIDRYRNAVSATGLGWRKATKGLADFRNDIMHPSRIFAGSAEARPAKLVDWEHRLDTLIGAAQALASNDVALGAC